MISRTKLTLATLLMLSFGAQAQALPEALLNATRKAVLTSPEVQARWNGFKAARSEQDVPRAGLAPQVDLTSSAGHENRSSPLADYGNYNFRANQLTLNQMLFDGMFSVNEVKRLGYVKLTRYYELADISETTAMEAVRAYVDVVRYRSLIDAATQNYVEHKQSAMQVEERANAGVGRRADVEQATGRLALAESNLLVELTNLHDVSARYLRVVGEKPPANLPPLPEPFKLGNMPASTDVLMRDGLQGSPLMNAALENTRAYNQAIQSSQAAYLPRVDIRAYQTWDKNLSGTAGSTDVKGVQLVLSDNLYRGGADLARTRQASDQKAQARDLQEKACREVRQTLSIAYGDVRRMSEQQRYLSQHQLSTEKSHQAYRQQFDIGQRTLLDLLDSQNEYFEATRAHINARHDHAAAQARTLAGMGQLLSVLGVKRTDVPDAQGAGQDRSSIDAAELCPLEETEVDTVEAIKARFATSAAAKANTDPKPGSYVVLIPSPDGSIGRVAVQGTRGQQQLTRAYQGASLDGGGAPIEMDRRQVERDFAPAIAARPPLPEQFVLYFNQGGTQLTKESKALMPRILARARARQALDVWLVGHTDTMGTTKRNDALGLKRAQALAKHFQQLGLKNGDMSIESYGERSPQVATPDETREPRNRRGEVTLR
jgi:adhesin transport system outer membrane protein